MTDSVPATTSATRERVRWLPVAVFYVLACAISWPFIWWREMDPESFAPWRVPQII